MHAEDEQEVGIDDDEIREKFYQDMANQEKERTQRIFNQVILGNNRKRKRGEIELDDMDELSKRKQERINQLIDSDESDGDGFGFEEQMKKK